MGKRKALLVGTGDAVVKASINAKRVLIVPQALLEVAGIAVPCEVVLSAAEGSGEIRVKAM